MADLKLVLADVGTPMTVGMLENYGGTVSKEVL